MKRRIILFACIILLLPLLFSCIDADRPEQTQADVTGAATGGTHTAQTSDVAGTAAADTAQTSDVTGTGAADTDDAELSPDVTVNGSVLLNPTTVMVYGKCDKDCAINVYNGDQTFTVRADGVNFCFAASVKTDEDTEITVKAVSAGKAESAGVKVAAKGDADAQDSGLTVSYGSRLYEKKILPDLYGTNTYTKKELKTIKELAEYRVSKAREASGKRTEVIYAVAPNPLSVYDDELTESMIAHIENRSARMKQAAEALSEVEGVTFIDLTEILVSNRDQGKLYYNLDSHWTELGAYFGYKAIMDHISEKFPSAAPYPLSDYMVKYFTVDDTDLNVYSGVGTGKMFEDAPFLRARFTEQTPYGKNKGETARIWDFVNAYFKSTSVTHTKDSSLPSAVLLMDSYGLNAVPFIAERFSTLAIQPVWYYNADYNLIAEVKADYVIEILEERDLGVLLSGS